MFRQFFHLTKGDKKGFLVIFIIVFLIYAWVLGYRKTTSYTNERVRSAALDSIETEIKKAERTLFDFDPNEVDSVTMLSLGLSPKVAHNVLRYRAKGGIFSTPESFGRVYGMIVRDYEALLPHIKIGRAYQLMRDQPDFDQQTLPKPRPQIELEPNHKLDSAVQKRYVRQEKYPKGTIIDLNAADTTELKKIPGIGSYNAQKIVKRRKLLGGFYDVAQLDELGMMADSLSQWFEVKESYFPTIEINKWGAERLKQHPYLNFYLARLIVVLRKSGIYLNSLDRLSMYDEFSDADIARLAHYVTFERRK